MTSTDSLLRAPSGAITHVGAAARVRRQVEETAATVFRGWGYEEILLPLFDHAEVFARGGGRWSERSSYRFTEGGDLLALRADFTALAARAAATRLPREAERLFYRGEVVRRPGRGLGPSAFREVGVEHFAAGPGADLEILMVALEVLERLGVDGFVFTLGHAGYPLGLLDEALAGAADRMSGARKRSGDCGGATPPASVLRSGRALPRWCGRSSSLAGTRCWKKRGEARFPVAPARRWTGSPASPRCWRPWISPTGSGSIWPNCGVSTTTPGSSSRSTPPAPVRRSEEGVVTTTCSRTSATASGRRFLALGGPDLRDPPRVIGLRPRPRPNHRGWWTGHREWAGGPLPEGPRRPEAGRRHSIRVRTLSSRGKPIRDVARTS